MSSFPDACTSQSPYQPSLFDIQAETERALQAVELHAEDAWKEHALEAVERTCRRLERFISDDIWDGGLESTREDRALGPILLKARKLGWCVKTGELRASKRSHLSGKPVWKSLLFEARA